MKAETVFLKLGGSLITEKQRKESVRLSVLARVAGEIAEALQARPDMRLVLGHGSGSFGHFAAERYGIHLGCRSDWWGYAQTAAAAARLNRLVVDVCLEARIPVVTLQPSASARTHEGRLVEWTTWPVDELLGHGLVPVVYGDVALDDEQGCSIISTEQIFDYLAHRIPVRRILLAGEVDGVFTGDPHCQPGARRIARLTPRAWESVARQLAGARGVDVTGGMFAKVQQMLRLVESIPELEVSVFSGLEAGRVKTALLGCAGGTLLSNVPCQLGVSEL